MVGGGVRRGPAFDPLLATDYRIATGDLGLELVGAGGAAWPGMALYQLASQLGPRSRPPPGGQPAVPDSDSRHRRRHRRGVRAQRGRRGEPRPRGGGVAGRRAGQGVRHPPAADQRGRVQLDEALGPHLAARERAARLAGQGVDAGSVPAGRLSVTATAGAP
jgi:hypothetical protein